MTRPQILQALADDMVLSLRQRQLVDGRGDENAGTEKKWWWYKDGA